jgi:UDPglucose 6-dehydrogenase
VKIGFVGLGKLGLPVALAIASKGHEVLAFDVNPAARRNVERRRLPHPEQGADELFARARLRVGALADVVDAAEILFIAVQTPHEPRLDGTSRLPPYRRDFDYSHLVSAVADVAAAARERDKRLTLAVMSTVLPTTMDREVRPLLPPGVTAAYTPSFTAMGTTIPDFLNPEFVLLGLDEPDGGAAAGLKRFYATLHDRPVFETDLRTAELIKVAYNTFIGQKIVFANTMMELCHKLGADVDAVTGALGLARDRIISTRYLRGGMGDGGPCHPRDNIALSWLSRELGLAHDVFSDIMEAREHQIEWFADLLEERAAELPIVILGKAFKADTPLADGSPAQLLATVLRERGVQFAHYDGHVDQAQERLDQETASLFFIATCHTEYASAHFPSGSVVLDPWGYVPDRDGVTVVRIGRR